MKAIVGVKRTIKTTLVYDTYWRFAVERQRTFFRRLHGEQPYSADSIISQHRFTNAYRASDRVSQYLVRKVIYAVPSSPEDVFFRTMLFRIFNKIETWEMLQSECGRISWSDFTFERYDALLTAAMSRGERIYSAAYIMPSRAAGFDSPRKHRNHLHMLAKMMKDELPKRLMDSKSASDAFMSLRSYPMVGDFLGYQFLTDLNYGPLLSFSEMDFVIAGPGAASGLRKCFSETGGLSEADLIRFVTEKQEEEFTRREIDFPSLWGRPLQLIDCQNLFCEVDKYARVAHPEFTPPNGRSRIKQQYRPAPSLFRVWYPPKWGINDQIPGSLQAMA